MSRIEYLTADEVNAAHARELAHRFGVELTVRHPSERPRRNAARIIDWDFLGPEEQANVLEEAGSAINPVALHSYQVGLDPIVDRLVTRGLLLYRRLDDELFSALLVRKVG